MGPLNRSTDQLDPAAISTRRQRSRSIAPFLLLASLLLVVENWGYRLSPFLVVAFVFLVLSIVGILARQWIFVSLVVAPIAGIVGLGILLRLPHDDPPPEAMAVGNLRTINTAQVTYLSSSGGNFGDLPALVAAGLLDDTFIGTATHPKGGYIYNITATGSDYTATADPASAKTGRYGYYTVPDAVIRYSTNASLAPTGQSGCSVELLRC